MLQFLQMILQDSAQQVELRLPAHLDDLVYIMHLVLLVLLVITDGKVPQNPRWTHVFHIKDKEFSNH